jgi:hypothetical protein
MRRLKKRSSGYLTWESEEEANVLAETVDQNRAAYIKQYFTIERPLREI